MLGRHLKETIPSSSSEMGKQNLQAKEVYYLSLIIDLINCDSKQALSVTTVLILNATTPVNNFLIENLPVDMKPLSAHNIIMNPEIFWVYFTSMDCLTKSPYLDSRIRFRIFHPEKRILNSYLLMQE